MSTEKEIEITPQMVEAGFEVLSSSGIADSYLGADRTLVAQIFLAMWRASRGEVRETPEHAERKYSGNG